MRNPARPAAVLNALAVPAAPWWLIGDQSTTGPENADYVVQPPLRLSNKATRALGIGALVVSVAAAASLIGASASHSFDPSWWSVIVPLLLLGILLALGGRVFTPAVVAGNLPPA